MDLTSDSIGDAMSVVRASIDAACRHCYDSSLVWTADGPVPCRPCFKAQREFSPAAHRLSDRAREFFEKQRPVDQLDFHAARILLHGSAAAPVSGFMLREWMGLSERQIKSVVETLRRDWRLPLISRRAQPSGYWYAATGAEFNEWFRTIRSQAVSELTLCYGMARGSYPELVGQTPLDFIGDFTRELQEALA